jgi:hypothetical protein
MAKRSDVAEMLVLFWLLRRSQVALSPLGVGLALNRIVVKVLARVSVSLASPFRRRPINRTHILAGAFSLASRRGQNNHAQHK